MQPPLRMVSSGWKNETDLSGRVEAALAGILVPESIAIHVAQNTVAFVASSLAWLVIWQVKYKLPIIPWLTRPLSDNMVGI